MTTAKHKYFAGCSPVPIWVVLAILLLSGTELHAAAPKSSDYFALQVVDDESGRGVPLVELKTVNDIKHYTDSAGWVAFHEPGLMDQTVYFHLKSHGYEFPKDGFGNRGQALKTTPGKTETLRLKRLNIAERLYRVTGQGIYRDSVLLGRPVPLRESVLNGLVLGQDTVIVTPYRNRLYWFWGDTDRAAYPLGNFAVSGATSALPGQGGLAPSLGVDLHYFKDANGFAKKMLPLNTPGLVWIEGVFTVKDDTGRERLLATYTRQDGLKPPLERGLALFNDSQELFEPLTRFQSLAGHDSSHTFKASANGRPYWYLFNDWRVPDHWSAVTNEASYEAYTCLAKPNITNETPRLDRDAAGQIVYSWKAGFPRPNARAVNDWVRLGLLKTNETPWQMRDLDTGTLLPPMRGSVCWNEFRRRWIMIASSFGDVWFSQADTPTGPWTHARRILQHDNYTFYNPAQHPWFDQRGGRLIYFEGTYTDSFSAAKERTPRYNYNQIMYRLSLEDERTLLPTPVYRVESGGREELLTRDELEERRLWPAAREIVFHIFAPQAGRGELIPLYKRSRAGRDVLATAPHHDGLSKLLGFIPKYDAATNSVPAGLRGGLVPLRRFVETTDAEPLGRVWGHSAATLPLDPGVQPR